MGENIEMALRVECKRRFHSTNEKRILKKCELQSPSQSEDNYTQL